MRVIRSSGERLSSIGSNPGSAVLYAHGGGMISSNVGIYDGPVARYVSGTGVPFLSWSTATPRTSSLRPQ